jgi:molybdate transport system regulatory protein
MQISARNQIIGTVQDVKQDDVMAEVTLKLEGGTELVSVITADSASKLGIAVGKKVSVIIKSTDVMLGAD